MYVEGEQAKTVLLVGVAAARQDSGQSSDVAVG